MFPGCPKDGGCCYHEIPRIVQQAAAQSRIRRRSVQLCQHPIADFHNRSQVIDQLSMEHHWAAVLCGRTERMHHPWLKHADLTLLLEKRVERIVITCS
jgi:hypothetical protein